jgi:hypothetical protein
MRTKTALLTATLVAAGVASSMAQSNVYSVNIVGYVNLTVTPGYNLISLPIQNADPTSSINSVLTNSSYNGSYVPASAGTAVFTWNGHGFNQPMYAGGDGNWYDQTGVTLQTNPLVPGQGFFLQMPSTNVQIGNGETPKTNLTFTLVGSVLTGTNSYPVTAGYNFYGNFLPISGNLCTNGFPVVDNSAYYTYNGHGYNQPFYGLGTNDSATNLSGNPGPVPIFTDQSGTILETVAPAVGQGFLYQYLGTSTSWTQVFSVAQ